MRSTYLLLIAVLPVHGCDWVHSCTEIGCGDSATVRLQTADGTWPDGAYTFVFTSPDAVHRCQLALPGELPAPGSLRALACSPPLSANLSPTAVCTEERAANAVSESCRPVPGQFVLEAHVTGTPATLSLRVERSGTVLLEESRSLRYTEERPNGPGCDPLCRQTSLELTLP
jgi:hypothetical protein